MVVLFFVVIGFAIIEYFAVKKTRLGCLLPIASFIYLIFQYIIKSKEPNFMIMDLLFQAILFAALLVMWFFTTDNKKHLLNKK